MSERQIPVKIRYAEDFKRVYATGAMGGFNGYDFRVSFFNDNVVTAEDPTATPSAIREMHVEVIMSPLAAKQLRNWLNKNIDDVEKITGEIKETKTTGQTKNKLPPTYG